MMINMIEYLLIYVQYVYNKELLSPESQYAYYHQSIDGNE